MVHLEPLNVLNVKQIILVYMLKLEKFFLCENFLNKC